MRSLTASLALLSLGVAVLLTPVALAFPDFLVQATTTYPGIVGSKLDDCALCHQGAGGTPLNPYGADFRANGFSVGAIEGMDSDGDGASNLVEIMALTWPGDARDTPGGGGGGNGRVVARGTLADVTDASAMDLAADTDRAEGLATWIDDTTVVRSTTAVVRSRLVTGNGSATGKVTDVGSISGSQDQSVAAAYGKKRFMVAWNGDDGDVLAQPLKSKTGKKVKKTVTAAAGNVDPSMSWDAGRKLFLLGTGSDDGVLVTSLDKNGKVKSATRSSLIGGVNAVFSFANGASSVGEVMLSAEPSGTKQRGVGILLDGGAMSSMSSGYYKYSSKAQDVAAAYGTAEKGAVAWSIGRKLYVGSLNSDGSLNGKAKRVKKAKSERIGLAAQSNGTFLLVWTDAKTRQVMAIDVDANGKAVGTAFELQDTGEVIDIDALGVARVGNNVMVTYATTGTGAAVRSAIVKTR